VQTCIWPSGCHCHSLSLAAVKSRLVYPAHPGSPGQRVVKWVCVCVCVSLMPIYINTYMWGSARTKLTVITSRSYLLCSIYTVNYALRFAYATLLGCVTMQCITTFYVAWSVCLSVLQKQMNQLQCRLGYDLGWS